MPPSITSSIISSIGPGMSDASEKVKENRLRRMAERQGLRLVKSRRRDPHAIDFGKYALVSAETNGIVFGSGSFGYDADLEDIERYLTED
jgi:hypothetical protein